MELVITILPYSCSTMYFCAALEQRKLPLRCTSSTLSQSSSLILNERLSRNSPALLTRMSIRPKRWAISSNAFSTCCALDTSQAMAIASDPALQPPYVRQASKGPLSLLGDTIVYTQGGCRLCYMTVNCIREERMCPEQICTTLGALSVGSLAGFVYVPARAACLQAHIAGCGSPARGRGALSLRPDVDTAVYID